MYNEGPSHDHTPSRGGWVGGHSPSHRFVLDGTVHAWDRSGCFRNNLQGLFGVLPQHPKSMGPFGVLPQQPSGIVRGASATPKTNGTVRGATATPFWECSGCFRNTQNKWDRSGCFRNIPLGMFGVLPQHPKVNICSTGQGHAPVVRGHAPSWVGPVGPLYNQR